MPEEDTPDDLAPDEANLPDGKMTPLRVVISGTSEETKGKTRLQAVIAKALHDAGYEVVATDYSKPDLEHYETSEFVKIANDLEETVPVQALLDVVPNLSPGSMRHLQRPIAHKASESC